MARVVTVSLLFGCASALTPVTVALAHDPPFVYATPASAPYGVLPDLLGQISAYTSLSCATTASLSCGVYFQLQGYPSSDAAATAVLNGTAQMIGTLPVIDAYAAQGFSFTYPWALSDIAFVSLKVEQQRGFLFFLDPFEGRTWAATLGGFALVAVSMALIDRWRCGTYGRSLPALDDFIAGRGTAADTHDGKLRSPSEAESPSARDASASDYDGDGDSRSRSTSRSSEAADDHASAGHGHGVPGIHSLGGHSAEGLEHKQDPQRISFRDAAFRASLNLVGYSVPDSPPSHASRLTHLSGLLLFFFICHLWIAKLTAETATPLYSLPYASWDDLTASGRKVGIIDKSLSAAWINASTSPRILAVWPQLVHFPDEPSAVAAVRSGQVVALVTHSALARDLALAPPCDASNRLFAVIDDQFNLGVASMAYLPAGSGVVGGVAPPAPDSVAAINRGIATASQLGRFSQIETSYIRVPGDCSSVSPIKAQAVSAASLAAPATIFAGALAITAAIVAVERAGGGRLLARRLGRECCCKARTSAAVSSPHKSGGGHRSSGSGARTSGAAAPQLQSVAAVATAGSLHSRSGHGVSMVAVAMPAPAPLPPAAAAAPAASEPQTGAATSL